MVTLSFQEQQFEKLCRDLNDGNGTEIHVSNLRYGPLTEKMWDILMDPQYPIRCLYFHIYIPDTVLEKLACWLSAHTTKLQSLSLEYCDESTVNFLRLFLDGNGNNSLAVETLELSFRENFSPLAGDEDLIQVFFSNLRASTVRFFVRNELGQQSQQQVTLLECVWRGLAENRNLIKLEFFLASGCELSKEVMEYAFQNNSTFRQLTIIGIDRLREPFVTNFLIALQSSCVPRELGLHCLTREATVALFQGLASAVKIESLKLTIFRYQMSDLEILSASLAQNTNIRKLALDSHVAWTLSAIEATLVSHESLHSVEILGSSGISNSYPIVERILEDKRSRMKEFTFPIGEQDDASAVLKLIPRLTSVHALKIVNSAPYTALLDIDDLINALEYNTSLVRFDYYPRNVWGSNSVRLHEILRRNAKLKRRKDMTRSIALGLERCPQVWSIALSEMLKRDEWFDTTFFLIRELVLLQQLHTGPLL